MPYSFSPFLSPVIARSKATKQSREIALVKISQGEGMGLLRLPISSGWLAMTGFYLFIRFFNFFLFLLF
jgi:hypothetical protein